MPRSSRLVMILALASAALGPAVFAPRALAQAPAGTAFTYQGRLDSSGAAMTGNADFEFRLFDAPSGGTQVGAVQILANLPVDKGLFGANLDFGPEAFRGEARYLEIAVRSPAGSGSFTTLLPRQAITPAPHASFASRPWATNGSTISYTGGSVGVGTSSPTSLFEIAGAQDALKVRGDAPYITLIDSNAANARVLLQNSQGKFYTVSENFLNGTNTGAFTVVDPNGRLGIGTHNPAGPLEVRAGSNSYFAVDAAEGDVRFNGGTDGHFGFFNDSLSGSTAFIARGRHNLFIHNSGQIGLGSDFVQSGRQVEITTGFLRALSMSSTDTRGTTIEVFNRSSFKAWEFWVAGSNPLDGQEPGALTIQNQSTSNPALAIALNNFVGLEVPAPSFRLDLPNIGDARGRARANAWTTYSSGRWKHNVQPISDALDKVLSLRGVSFDWNAEHGGSHDIGFVAEEVGKVIPEVVTYEADGVNAKGLAYDRLTALTVEAIREQQAQIKALQESNALLQKQVEVLKGLVGTNAAAAK
jgi:hypothetical protein